MDEKVMREVFHELISSLEALDTQSSAISQFLQDKGIVDSKELAPYLERAGNASSVRWLGSRVRIDYLFSTAAKETEEEEDNSARDAAVEEAKNAGGNIRESKTGETGGHRKDEPEKNQENVEGSKGNAGENAA
jgi:hypothetical protein